MLKRIRLSLIFFALLGLALTLTGTAVAQGAGDRWEASYWNNVSLSGEPELIRFENQVNHDWGQRSPHPTVSPNRFSARWTRTLTLEPGRYRFTVTADDGVRLWVNNQLLIEEWRTQAATTYSAEIYLEGSTPVTMEYFENTGQAVAQLNWTRISAFTANWYGEYFNNRTLSGEPAVVRNDAAIDFDWGLGSPAPAIDPNNFSARWQRSVDLPAGQYRFTVTVDDGARLWVNDQLLIDRWQSQPATTYTAEISLFGGPTPIQLEYYESGGFAEVSLDWTRLHAPPTPGSGNIVDNGDGGFVSGGDADDWHLETEGHGGSLRWSENSEMINADYNWARWYPNLTPGSYEVFAYIPDRFTTTSQARYWISHADDYTLRAVDQSANGGQWVSLGVYRFDGSDEDFVSLADVTFEADESTLVAFDAVRWVSVADTPADPAATVSPVTVAPGTEVIVTGRNFAPGQTVELSMGPPQTEPFGQYGEETVAADGTVAFSFIMPRAWPGGDVIESTELVVLLMADDGSKATASFTYQP